MPNDMNEPVPTLRIDKWLWWARFFITRSLAAKIVAGGLQVNGTRTNKSKTAIKPGDTLTFMQERSIRVIRVVALGHRRGPASEAAALYEDLAPPEPPKPRIGPRPTKKDRRDLTTMLDDPTRRDV
jgi:ribosome-associated heat shock protein Hsp15